MNILAIGNSFSQDAMRNLHDFAKSAGYELTAVNLFIGGCPLSLHHQNMREDNKAYFMEQNGVSTGSCVSIREALCSRDWDYVTLQQVSSLSFRYETYQPYLNELADYVRRLAPSAQLVIHETWAYEQGSERLRKMGYSDRKEMYRDLHAAYEQARIAVDADAVIPSGTMFEELISAGITDVYRDTFHASLDTGRTALALLWLRVLTGCDVSAVEVWTDVPKEKLEQIKRCVMKTPVCRKI